MEPNQNSGLQETILQNQDSLQVKTIQQVNANFIQQFLKPSLSFIWKICIIFACFFTLFFYKTSLGLNTILFTLLTILCTNLIFSHIYKRKFSMVSLYHVFALIFALLCMVTTNPFFLFLQVILILCFLSMESFKKVGQNFSLIDMISDFKFVKFCFTTLSTLFYPIIHLFQHSSKESHSTIKKDVFLGTFFAFIFLLFMVPILLSSDILFEHIFLHISNVIFGSSMLLIIFLFFVGFFYLYCSIMGNVKAKKLLDLSSDSKKSTSTYTFELSFTFLKTFYLLINIVYIIFSGSLLYFIFSFYFKGIQEKINYASYVHSGFYQLIFAAAINFLLITFSAKHVKNDLILKILLIITTICTYIMLLSNLFRMSLYVDAYRLTFLRVIVLFFSLILALLLLVNISHVLFPKNLFYRYHIYIVLSLYILFVLSMPDAFIARYNLNHSTIESNADINYLVYDLSLDASPIVYPYLKEQRLASPSRNQAFYTDYQKRLKHYTKQSHLRNFQFTYLSIDSLLSSN